MRPLELLWAILAKFVPFPQGRLAQLKDESFKWENEQKESNTKVGKMLVKSEAWYWQAGCAILFMIGLKSIANWMVEKSEPDLIDEDEIPSI